ncbi:MAG TPA: DinB family protein [Candidatus Limnocylindrales bacterium]
MADVGRRTARLAPLLERLSTASDSLLELRPAVESGSPWPLSNSIGVEPEAHWGPPEVLAHVAEMLPFWLGEIERVIAGADEPVPFGRVATDQLRIGVIERDRSLPPRELFDRVASDVARYRRRLGELDDAAVGKRGLHPTRGELTIAEILERFATSHLEEHVEQLRETLARSR